MVGEPFLLGVNYWPRAKAMWWWADFDPGEVREEFAMIRELGLGYVRIFLLWESFQPRPDTVDGTALTNLRTVARHRRRIGPASRADVLHRPHERPELGAGLAPRPVAPLRQGDRQVVSLGRRSVDDAHPQPVHRAVRARGRTAPAAHGVRRAGGSSGAVGLEPRQRARPLLPTADGHRRAGMDGGHGRHDPRRATPTTRCSSACTWRVGRRRCRPARRRRRRPRPTSRSCTATRSTTRWPASRSIPSSCRSPPPSPRRSRAARSCTRSSASTPSGPTGRATGRTSRKWDGGTRRAYFASEDDAAAYYAGRAERLHRVGCLGAFAWCFGDYARTCGTGRRATSRRTSGSSASIAPDGTLKPMGAAMRDFALGSPMVQAAGADLAPGRSAPTSSTPIPSAICRASTNGSSGRRPRFAGRMRRRTIGRSRVEPAPAVAPRP